MCELEVGMRGEDTTPIEYLLHGAFDGRVGLGLGDGIGLQYTLGGFDVSLYIHAYSIAQDERN